MSEEIPNKRYTPECQQQVVEAAMQDGMVSATRKRQDLSGSRR